MPGVLSRVAEQGPQLAISSAAGGNMVATVGRVLCATTRRMCQHHDSTTRPYSLAEGWKDLVRVNKWVNKTIKPLTDLEHWGVVERWSYPDDGYG